MNYEYDKIRRRANQRLRRLRTKHPDSPALKAAERYVGRGQLYNVEKDPIKQNRQISEINRFLNMKTSTSTGIKELDAENRKYLIEAGVSADNVDSVFEFIKNDLWSELKITYDSGQVLEAIDEMLNEGVKYDQIINILRNATTRLSTPSDYEEALKNGRNRGFNYSR